MAAQRRSDSDEVESVLNGFIHLSDEEREEFLERISEYQETVIVRKREIAENVEKRVNQVYAGPTPTACPCCGR